MAQKFSEATTDGNCPKCGGGAFKAKRSMVAKTMAVATAPVGGAIVAAPFLIRKGKVKCVTCGTMFKRG